MINQPQELSLGQLTLIDVYEYYDEPIMYSCVNESDRRFIAVLAASDEFRKVWIYAPVSLNRLSSIRNGKLAIYDAFRLVEGGAICRAEWSRKKLSWECSWVTVSSISDDLLPSPGVFVDSEMDRDAAGSGLPDVGRISAQIHRDVLAVKIKIPKRHDHEAPASIVGPLISRLQETITVIGQNKFSRGVGKSKGWQEFPKRTQLDVASTFAGSFGVELRANTTSDLFGDSPLLGVIEEFIHLVRLTANESDLRAAISSIGGRVPSKYLDLLLSVRTVDTLDLDWGSPKLGSGGRAQLTSENITSAISMLSNLAPLESREFPVVARLIGVNVRTKRYEILDETENVKYSGKIDDAAMDAASAATVNRVYLARIFETESVGLSGEVESTHRLVSLEHMSSD